MENNIKVTPQPTIYTLYATLRDSEEPILMCETTSLENIEMILNLFETSRYIAKFSIVRREDDKKLSTYKEKVLKRRI